jgi:hypothetical protein
MTTVQLGSGEAAGLGSYLDRLLALDGRAVVRLQARGAVVGVWSGPPFDVVALRPVALAAPAEVDVTVSARRLRERMSDSDDASLVEVPSPVPGPSWVGLLPPRSGWQERGRTSVGQVRSAVESAVHFFRTRADGVTDRVQLDAIAADVWQRAVLAEVPVRAAHAAEALGLLGPADGEVVAHEALGWQRLQVPGGSVACRRELTGDLGQLLAAAPDRPDGPEAS